MDQPIYVDFAKKKDCHYEYIKQPNGKVYIYECPSSWESSQDCTQHEECTLLGAEVLGDSTKIELIGERKQEMLATLGITPIEQSAEAQPKKTKTDATPKQTKTDATPKQTKTATKPKTAKKVALPDSYRKTHALYRFFAKDSIILRQLRHALEAVEIYLGCKTIRPKVNALIEYLFCDQTGSLDDTKNAQSTGHLHASSFLSDKQVAQICEQLGANQLVDYRIWKKRSYRFFTMFLIVEADLFPPYSSASALAAEDLAPPPEFRLFVMHDFRTLEPISFFVVPGTGSDYEAWEQHIDAIRRRELNQQCIWVTNTLGLSRELTAEFNALGMTFVVPEEPQPDKPGTYMAVRTNRQFNAQESATLARKLKQIAVIHEPFQTKLGWLKDRTWAECQNRFKGQMILIFCALCLSDEAEQVLATIYDELKHYTSKHPSNSAQTKAYHELQVWLYQLMEEKDGPALAQIFNWFRAEPPLNAEAQGSSKRWSKKALERDRLFYAMLGLEPFPDGFTDLPKFPWFKQPY